jgi:dCMP deaminase
MERINRTELLKAQLALYEQRSTCLRGQVAALIVKDRRVIASGYNGSPPGLPECLDVGCEDNAWEGLARAGAALEGREFVSMGCQRTTHAEANAIAWAAREGIRVSGAEMWCSYSPCYACAKLILSAGIVRVAYVKEYRLSRIDILDEAGIEVIYLGDPDESKNDIVASTIGPDHA